ncbi:Nn.00g048450.m01.CDS01 [Neocucurbitaria sp. VM-36]
MDARRSVSPTRAAVTQKHVHQAQGMPTSSPFPIADSANILTDDDTAKDGGAEWEDIDGSQSGQDRSSPSGDTENSSDTTSKPWNLQAIHDFVDEEDLTDTLYCLPELDAYTFVDSPDAVPAYGNAKMLFLGEDKFVQAWARVKEFENKPDAAEFISIDQRTGNIQVVRDIEDLPINIYPFDIAHGKSTDVKKGVSILVRYVFREASHVDESFSPSALTTFGVVLNVIQKAIDNIGGDAELLLSSYAPSKLPSDIVQDAARNISVKTDRRPKTPHRLIQASSSQTPKPAPARERLANRKLSTPAPPPFTSGKRPGDIDDDTIYSELMILEAKRTKYANEQVQLLLRQDDTKRRKDTERRLLEIKRLEAAVCDEVHQLLEGKSAVWFVEQQRKFKEEDEG